jgi:hypothetical protein
MNQPTQPKGKPRGRKGGRPPSPTPHKRINVYLSLPDLAALLAIHPSPSQAVRQLINKSDSQGESAMKTVTATLTNRNQPAVTVQLPNVPESAPLTPKLARSAARIAFGHSDGVTVLDGDNGYALTKSGARLLSIESF